jgi:hypothetical protein
MTEGRSGCFGSALALALARTRWYNSIGGRIGESGSPLPNRSEPLNARDGTVLRGRLAGVSGDIFAAVVPFEAPPA